MGQCWRCGEEANFGGARCDSCGIEICDQCLDGIKSKGGLIGEQFWLCPNCGEHKLTS